MSWLEHAACKGKPIVWWFPTTRKGHGSEYRQARQICGICPVRLDCLEDALRYEGDHRFGMYGGLTPPERDRLMAAVA